jgi:Rieske Fe-S protein
MTPLAAQDPRTARPMAGDRLAKVDDETTTPLTTADIPLMASPILAWPVTPDGVPRSGSRLNRVALVRLDVMALTAPTRSHAADGIVAYSAVCTHTGCEVGAFLADEQVLYCDCHGSKFDPHEQARVTDGPAPRSLPALPLRVVEGRLEVAGPFTARPGVEQG